MQQKIIVSVPEIGLYASSDTTRDDFAMKELHKAR